MCRTTPADGWCLSTLFTNSSGCLAIQLRRISISPSCRCRQRRSIPRKRRCCLCFRRRWIDSQAISWSSQFSCLHRLGIILLSKTTAGRSLFQSKTKQPAGPLQNGARLSRSRCHEIDGCDFEQTSQALSEAVAKAVVKKGLASSSLKCHVWRSQQ